MADHSHDSGWFCGFCYYDLLDGEFTVFPQFWVSECKRYHAVPSALLTRFAFALSNFSSRAAQREVKSVSFAKFHSCYEWSVHL